MLPGLISFSSFFLLGPGQGDENIEKDIIQVFPSSPIFPLLFLAIGGMNKKRSELGGNDAAAAAEARRKRSFVKDLR